MATYYDEDCSAFLMFSRKFEIAWYLDKSFRKPNCCNIGFVLPQEIEYVYCVIVSFKKDYQHWVTEK